MKLPIVPDISTKDGSSNKNARLFNALKETKPNGDTLAVVRPGLILSNDYAGLGSGLIVFDHRLLTAVDNTIYDEDTGGFWDLASPYWDAAATYDYWDSVWYDSGLWYSVSGGNEGNPPTIGSAYWSRSGDVTNWENGTSYNLGDSVTVNSETYYSYTNSNTGNYPSRSPDKWKKTPIDTTLTMGSVTYTPLTIDGIGFTQTASWTIYKDGNAVGSGNGSLVSSFANPEQTIAQLVATNWPRASTALLGGIADYSPRPATPPEWVFTGMTQWSGLPGWVNNAWAPSQSSGSWAAMSL